MYVAELTGAFLEHLVENALTNADKFHERDSSNDHNVPELLRPFSS